MFRRFATREEIANALSQYKKHEIVTLLTDFITDDGKFEVGTKFKVKEICLPISISIPKIHYNEMVKYYINESAFAYTLELISDDEEKHELHCQSIYFERGNLTMDEISPIYKRKSTMTLKNRICIGLFIIWCIAIIVLWVFMLYSCTNDSRSIGEEIRAIAGVTFFALVSLCMGGIACAGISADRIRRIRSKHRSTDQ